MKRVGMDVCRQGEGARIQIMKMEAYETEVEELLGQLTLEEKIGMIHGAGLFRTEAVERLSIPPLFMSDGPMGVRAEFADNEWRNTGTTDDFVSYLPCNSAVASTWNRELAGKEGEVLGEEARGRGKDVILAPGINIKRSPYCGRNFEYMSEDPHLISELVVPMVEGIQKSDVAACVKHFAANSQETERLWVDTIVSERALQEIYFPGFKAAVEKGGTYSLMGAYNLLNGEHCCTSKELLNKVLREAWGFDGMIISDWGGVHDTVLAAESALDIEMDTTYDFDKHHMADALMEKVRAGEIAESLVDEKVRNVLRLMFRLKMIGAKKNERKSGTYNSREHQDAVLKIARESMILLKNENDVLPLDAKKTKKIAVIGQNAASIHSNGGGSAEIKALYEITPLMGIKKMLGGNVKVCYAPGYDIPGKKETGDVNWQADSTTKNWGEAPEDTEVKGAPTENAVKYRAEAVALAKECDTVIYVGGLTHDFDSEGYDRTELTLPYGQDALIGELLAVNPNTIVVIYAGSPVAMPWKERAKAILFSYYAGMEGGTAIAETLFGKVNPSGKLAETFIADGGQCPAHTIGTFAEKERVEYREGVMVGYRHYDTVNENVAFCFGHGLSYSRFEYKYMSVTPARAQTAHGESDGVSSGGQRDVETDGVQTALELPLYEVAVTVKNTGDRAGKEVVQVYVAPKTSAQGRPCHELRAFEKVEIEPGCEKTVKFVLCGRAFSYYDEGQHEFVIEKGAYDIEIGSSSRDIRLRQGVTVFA